MSGGKSTHPRRTAISHNLEIECHPAILESRELCKLLNNKYFIDKYLFFKDLEILPAKSLTSKDWV